MNALKKCCRKSVLVALLVTSAFLAIGTAKAHAASFYMSPSSGTFKHGCTNSVRAIINTAGTASTAADIVLSTQNVEILGIRGGNAYSNYAGGGSRFTGFSIGGELNGTATFATISFRNIDEAQSGTISFVVGGSTNTVIADTGGQNILSGASGGSYSFVPGSCVEDTVPPKLVNANPANGATGVALNSNVKFDLTDGTGVDINSVVVTIEGITYGTQTPNNFKYSGSKTRYSIDIDPLKDFTEGQEVVVRATAKDTSDRKNTMNTSYGFNKPGPPPTEPPTCEELGCISECPEVAEAPTSLQKALDQPLFGPSAEEELERHFTAIEFEPEVSCIPKTKTEERKIKTSSIKESIKIPGGYELVIDPIQVDCQTPFTMTINVPSFYEDLRVLKCKGEECTSRTSEITESTECGDSIRDVSRKTIEYKAVVYKTDSREKTIQVSSEDYILESNHTKITFTEEMEKEVTVMIKGIEEKLPEALNPGLKIIGPSSVVTVYSDKKLAAEIEIPFMGTSYTYPESSAIYAKDGNEYKYIGGSVDTASNKVTAKVDDLLSYRGSDGKITLTVMGVICSNCTGSRIQTVHQPEEGSNTVVLLVHGLSGEAATFNDLINDIKQTNQNYTVMTFGYPTSNTTLEDIVKDFREVAGPKIAPYQNIIVVGHSVGSLIAQEALSVSNQEKDPYLKNVKKFISIGAPNEGSIHESALSDLFKVLVNRDSNFNALFDINSKLLPLLTEGRKVPKVKGIDYFAIAGTRGYVSLPQPEDLGDNDGIVSTESASRLGGRSIKNRCSDYWEIGANHSELLHSYQARQIIGRVLSEAVEESKGNTFGNNKYFQVAIDDCSEDVNYIIVGKRVDKLPDLEGKVCPVPAKGPTVKHLFYLILLLITGTIGVMGKKIYDLSPHKKRKWRKLRRK